jgi:predicted DNA binding CopG/RHH family protein
MAKRRDYEELGGIELSQEEDAKITEVIDQAERELDDTRVSFRWGKEQLEVVKRAAQVMGIPYQTFMKQVVFERAMSILKDAHAIKKPTDAA